MIKKLMLLVMVSGLVLAGSFRIEAMTNFARQYGASCTMCHTTIPKLNRTGYDFRRAGFRLPSEIGKESDKKFDLADKFAGRIQAKAAYNGMELAGATSSRTQLDFHEITIYPASGSFDKNWSSLIELSFLPAANAEIENAYIRYTSGDEKAFTSVRWGVMHPFEGFGASDRPISLSRPLFQSTTVNNFKIWGFDETGVEAGYTRGGTSITATLFNGINSAGKAAQGGSQAKAAGELAENNKDIQLFANHFIGDTNAAVSAYYYMGTLALGTVETNAFTRAAVYGNLPVAAFDLLAGYEIGRDTRSVSGEQNNSGYFVEIDWTPVSGNVGGPNISTALRYDIFDSNTAAAVGDARAITAALNLPFDNGFQLIAEAKNTSTQKATGEQKDNSVELRGISIF